VCSYNYVNLSFFEITDRLLLLRRCTETAQKIHTYRKLIHTLYKGVIDLLCKNGSRYQVNDLPALLHGFKRRTKRNLCLAISNVSAHKTIHDLGTFHIFLGVLNRSKLIFSFLIREHFFKLSLPYSIRTAYIPFFFLADRIKFHQFFRDILDCTFHSGFCLFPFLTAKTVQLRRFCSLRSRIFLKRIKLCCKDIQITAVAVFDLDIIFCNFIHRNLLNTTVDSQPMFFMNYKISNRKFREILNTFSIVFFLFLTLLLLFSKNVSFCDNRKFDKRIFKSLTCMTISDHDLARFQHTVKILPVKST